VLYFAFCTFFYSAPSSPAPWAEGPKPSKNKDVVLSLPAANAQPSERAEQQASSENINPTEVLESQLGNPHLMSSPLEKHLSSSVVGGETSVVGKQPQEQTIQVSKHQKKYAALPKKTVQTP